MPHQVTVTGQTGPARVNTAAILTAVNRIDFDLNDKLVQIYQDPSSGTTSVREFDLATVTTVTFTIAAGNYTMVIS